MLKVKTVESNGVKIALCESEGAIIMDGQSTLNFIAAIGWEHSCHNIAINKAAVAEDFFRLSTGVAGEVSQKIVNYHVRLAVIGDFSGYTSKPLRDYIKECNRGGHLCFVRDESEALKKLARSE